MRGWRRRFQGFFWDLLFSGKNWVKIFNFLFRLALGSSAGKAKGLWSRGFLEEESWDYSPRTKRITSHGMNGMERWKIIEGRVFDEAHRAGGFGGWGGDDRITQEI